MDEDQLKAEIERLRAENEALRKPSRGQVSLKISAKGAVSAYGLGRFPVNLYKEQWEKLLAVADQIKTFIAENDHLLIIVSPVASEENIMASAPSPTINDALQEFLAEQAARLSPKRAAHYRLIVEFLQLCLEGYWPGHRQEEYDRITAVGGSFCETFGPDELLPNYGEFLGSVESLLRARPPCLFLC